MTFIIIYYNIVYIISYIILLQLCINVCACPLNTLSVSNYICSLVSLYLTLFTLSLLLSASTPLV